MGFRQRLNAFNNQDYKYAFLELILIISGILIAFWIDTWWKGKQELQKERTYLSALKTEIQDNSSVYQNHLKELGRDIDITKSFIALIDSNPSDKVLADSMMSYLWSLKTIDIIIPKRAALDDLINSGGMQYIRSDILRREIAGYEQIFQQDLEKQRSTANQWNSSLATFELEHVNFAEVIPREGIKGLHGEERITLPRLNYTNDYGAFTSKEYVNRLIQRILLINSLRQTHQTVIEHIRRLVLLLELELDQESTTVRIEE